MNSSRFDFDTRTSLQLAAGQLNLLLKNHPNKMEHVEGEWNGLTFRRVTEDMADQVQELLLSSYYPDEPLSIRMGYTEDYDRDFQKFWKPHLGDGLSFGVFDKESGKLIGVRVSLESKKDDPVLDVESEQAGKIMKLLENINNQSDVFNKYNVDKCAFLLLTTVHRDFRGRGIVTEMYRRSIKLCKALGYKVIKVCFSSPFSRKGATTAGFKQVASIDYYSLKNEDGSKFIENSEPGDVVTQSIYVFDD